MVRKSRRGRVLNANPLGDESVPTGEERLSIGAVLNDRAILERLGATLMFFLTATSLVLFGLMLAYPIWHGLPGAPRIDAWTLGVVTPFGVLFSPVLFYLGWYFQARAKGQRVDLHSAMGGRFQAFCATLYGFLAMVTIVLAIVGAIGTALTDSNIVLITWAGMALVGIGLLAWLFRSLGGDVRMLTSDLLISKPTGIALATFSAVWLYPCATAYRQHDWAQFRGAAILFAVFLVPGCLSIWLSSRNRP